MLFVFWMIGEMGVSAQVKCHTDKLLNHVNRNALETVKAEKPV